MEHISRQYFDYTSAAGHEPSCSRYGTDLWEVTCRTDRKFNCEEIRGIAIRLVCHECGVIHFERSDKEMSTEITHASQIGFGSAPEKILGLWLWAGPRIWYGDDRGPTMFLVTKTNARPRTFADVIGLVAWNFTRRGALRWAAGIGYNGFSVEKASDQQFASRRAAVRWVLEAAR